MIYRFGPFELDTAKVELRFGGKVCSVEPQVFALLALLVDNRDRLVSKDEIIEKVWDGRVVSEAAVASRIKSARKVLGDDGRNQRFIKTIHRQGFRFVADATVARGGIAAEASGNPAVQSPDQASRPSIAVLPFRSIGAAGSYGAIADALPHELITELSRLRWLFVTARGSSFRLRGLDSDIGEIGRLLDVRYCMSGTVEIAGASLSVTVELVDTRDGGVVWADHFAGSINDVHQIREDVRSKILAALEIQIPLHEAALARSRLPRISMPGQPIISVSSTCTASTKETTLLLPRCSSKRLLKIPVSRAPMRVSLSSIFRRASCTTQMISPARLAWRDVSQRAASSLTRWIRSLISRWVEPSGSRATWKAA